MKLNPKAFGCALGVVKGLIIFVATVYVTWAGGGETLIKLSRFYIGYSVTYPGAIVGLIYGLIDGFIVGFVIASLYNIFAKQK